MAPRRTASARPLAGNLQTVPVRARSMAAFSELLGQEAVRRLRGLSTGLRARLDGRPVWNVNSTAAGGGVAEMLHSLLAYARGLKIDARWVVIRGNPEFFRITKRLHNAIHGEIGDGSPLGGKERAVYESVAAANADELCARVRAGDLVLLHDPQTAGMIPRLKEHGAVVIWRCHIGADQPTAEGDTAWSFLGPYLPPADAFVFSRFAYLPPACDARKSVVVAPSIDPFSAKNQDLAPETVRGILVHAGLLAGEASGGRSFRRSNGRRARVTGVAARTGLDGPPPAEAPLVLQVSRWDRLKDPIGVLEGFARVDVAGEPAPHLMLVGPDVTGVTDDPEGAQVHAEVGRRWSRLPRELRSRIHLVSLPMDDLEENAAMVNALQRHASIVVQKSLREGFGLTVTEAMWKGRAVVASAVGGIQDQIEHGVNGLLLRDPTDRDDLAALLEQLLGTPSLGRRLGANARRRVAERYLGLRSLEQYAELIERLGE